MNKSELINELSEATGFSKKDVAHVLDLFFKTVVRTLKKGERVAITGFGSFWTSFRPERMGINPATKQRIKLPKVSIPRFKPGKNLREGVKSVKLG
jgi:DNA-binding protein HU-beta